MPEQLQEILNVIKDYGSAIISTISVGGIAGVGVIIAKVKSGIDKTKEAMNSVISKKDKESEEMKDQYNSLLSTMREQNNKIDNLTTEINKVKKNV